MGKLYIAYGSNLNLAQMSARCPSATVYGVGRLNNWELLYRGRKGDAHATIATRKGAFVPVLVWEIQPLDERNLDLYEGFPYYYFKENIIVNINGKVRRAMVYIMNKSQSPATPSQRYVQTIWQGYEDNNLDLSVLQKSLEKNSIECRCNM